MIELIAIALSCNRKPHFRKNNGLRSWKHTEEWLYKSVQLFQMVWSTEIIRTIIENFGWMECFLIPLWLAYLQLLSRFVEQLMSYTLSLILHLFLHNKYKIVLILCSWGHFKLFQIPQEFCLSAVMSILKPLEEHSSVLEVGSNWKTLQMPHCY